MGFESAFEAVSNMKAGWNLGNTFDSFGKDVGEYSVEKYETLWHSPVTTRGMIEAVKKAGFDALRLPVTWDAHADENGIVRREWMDRVEEVANYALDAGMYCIINVHHDSGPGGWLYAEKENFEKNNARFAGIWKCIAERFRDYGEKLIFEGFNEMLDIDKTWNAPLSDESFEFINRYNQLFVDTVRATGGNNAERNLSVQTYAGAFMPRPLGGFEMPVDSTEGHMIAQIHNYDPQGFCWHKAVGQVLRDTWGTDEDKGQINYAAGLLKDFSARINAPVIIGEWGSQDKNNTSERAKHASYFVKTMAGIGVKCFLWDTVLDFSSLDRENEKMRFPEVIKAVTEY